MPLIIPANSITGGFAVDNSLRFNDGSSDYLNRTPASSGNRKTWTWSSWVKKSTIGAGYQFLFSCTDASTSTGSIGTNYDGDNKIYFRDDLISLNLTPNAVHRDTSAWYHIVVALDTTQATASNRAKMWINGTQVTSFSTETYPSQNTDGSINLVSGSYQHRIATYSGSSNFFDGYLAETVFIDGTALDPTSFGEFDEDSGIWKPIDVSELTFGTNGFYLDFENSGSLGADVSGNGNNFTVNNLTAIDQTTDTPTNNFCTINPLNATLTNSSLSEGNLQFSGGSQTVNYAYISGTIAPSQGKWYWEVKAVDNAEIDQVGVAKMDLAQFSNISSSGGLQATTFGGKSVQFSNGNKAGDGSQSAYMGGFSANDILMVALDLDSGNIYFGRNGLWSNGSGGADQTFGSATAAFTNLTVGDAYVPAHNMRDYGGSNSGESEYNFGNPPYTISSGNTDGNGYGNFEYAVPSGYLSLCTKNLSEVLG